jgi:hypothetical protein
MKNEFPYSLVEKISFQRCAGTAEERRAADILKDEIEKLGGEASYMTFPISDSVIQRYSVRVTAPYTEDVEALPYGLSGSLPEGGLDLKLYYAERGEKEDYLGVTDLSDTAVLVNELKPEVYALLCEKHAAAFLTIAGKYYENLESADAYGKNLRPHFLEKGTVPGFIVSARDATKLVREGVSSVHLELIQEAKEAASQNLLAVIPGTAIPEESVVLTAHYDSVPVGTGSYDNATGSAVLLYLYRYFLTHPAKRTLRFVWCGAEEIGLCGSKAYAEKQEDAMKEIRFCFNFDMCGTVLGQNVILVTGGDELKTFAEQFCREKGYSALIRTCVHSSDSAPFADKGIPALGLSRTTSTAQIHTHRDLIDIVCQKQLVSNGEFAINMIDRVANAAVLPVDMGMNEEMKQELDKYFHREEKTADR